MGEHPTVAVTGNYADKLGVVRLCLIECRQIDRKRIDVFCHDTTLI